MSHAYTVTDPSELYAATGQDRALFQSLAQMFLDTAPAMLDRMRQAALGGQGMAAPYVAASHSLRGTTALVGARGLTALLAELEAQAGSGTLPAGTTLDAVAAALAAVCTEVAHSIAAYPGEAA